MMAGWMLIEEKYDADKDGKLNEAEMTQLKADADKALEARRAARREARKAPAAMTRLRPLRLRLKKANNLPAQQKRENRDTAPSASRQAGFLFSRKNTGKYPAACC